MKILYVGVFSSNSTCISQGKSLRYLGYEIHCYDFRQRLGNNYNNNLMRDSEILNLTEAISPDLVLFAKANNIGSYVFTSIDAPTALWYMDPMNVNYNEDLISKMRVADHVFVDKLNVYEDAKQYNQNTHWLCEGFDQTVDYPADVNPIVDVSFIGNMYGDREKFLNEVGAEVFLAYGRKHADTVGTSKINLNLCTANGASDRVYKIMAAGGFLLTDDWYGRDRYFENGKHLVIFKDVEDCKKKIDYYLQNPKEREFIAKTGYKEVQKYSRLNWARTIVETVFDGCDK